MKYSELTSYLELAHWENESDNYYIKVYRNGHTVAAVGLLEQYSIRILDPTQMTEGLYRRLIDFARTPLTEREEEKRYYLRLATKIDVYEDRRYLNMDIPNEKYTLSENKDDAYYKAIFTESEIAQMDITGFQKVEVAE